MYVLVNAMFGFQLGRMKRNGTFTKKPKYYKDPQEMARVYCRLNALQRLVIVPALMNADGTYTRVEFQFEEQEAEAS